VPIAVNNSRNCPIYLKCYQHPLNKYSTTENCNNWSSAYGSSLRSSQVIIRITTANQSPGTPAVPELHFNRRVQTSDSSSGNFSSVHNQKVSVDLLLIEIL